MLIDVVGVEQRRGLEGGEQVLGDGFDERLGMAVLVEAFEHAADGRPPLRRRACVALAVNAVNSAWPKMAGFTSAIGSFSVE